MKPLSKIVLFAALTVLAACGGGGSNPPVGGGLAGTYSGEFVVANSSPFVSETVTLSIDAAGNVSGTTTGGSSSGTPGGRGTLAGTITGSSTNLSVDLTFTSSTLGTYVARGSGGIFNPAGKEIALSVNASRGGAFVGSFVMVVKQ